MIRRLFKLTLYICSIIRKKVIYIAVKPSEIVYVNLFGKVHISCKTVMCLGYRNPLPDLDGLDQWQAISRDLPSPRDTVLLDIYDRFRMYGIIMGPYKYIHGRLRTDIGWIYVFFTHFI